MYRASPRDGMALVTGASSGIGRGVALELAKRGYKVVALARRVAELEALAAQLPGQIIPQYGDVTDRAAIAAMVVAVEAQHGPIALTFLNAGTYYPDERGHVDADAVMRTFDINVGGTVNCLDPLVAAMVGRGKGQIAINASVAGYGPLPRSLAYGSTKAALINMAGSLKFALEASGINVQVVNPGFVRTPLTDKNDFPMPFMVELGAAATIICDGFERRGFEITFPRRLAWMLKALNLLPWPLYFWLVGSATASKKPDNGSHPI